jgi:hypothetical protein
MGGSPSKPTPATFTTSTVSLAEAQNVAAQQAMKAAETAASNAWGWAKIGIYILLFILVLGSIASGIYYYFTSKELDKIIDLKIIEAKLLPPGETSDSDGATGSIDFTSQIQGLVTDGVLHLPNGIAGQYPDQNEILSRYLKLTYMFSDDKITQGPIFIPSKEIIDISVANRNQYVEHFTNKRTLPPPTNKSGPTTIGKFSNMFNFTGSSPNLLPYTKDASSITTIPSASAPLSSGTQGDYGIQFWMYIKDWNYNFGKEKNVIIRTDPTNPAIANPKITLHPSDNSLKISVSIFPDSSGKSSKTEPAPYGHSGSTDDVFICEVPDIPLQTWVSVSVTVFSRNLDVYLNGKLVKSCVLSGVPKPVAGDITLNSDGGFSGYLCSFYHYPRMLTPTDTQSFFSQGHSCSADTDSKVAKATGYGFKFGVYDSQGKQLSQYVL